MAKYVLYERGEEELKSLIKRIESFVVVNDFDGSFYSQSRQHLLCFFVNLVSFFIYRINNHQSKLGIGPTLVLPQEFHQLKRKVAVLSCPSPPDVDKRLLAEFFL